MSILDLGHGTALQRNFLTFHQLPENGDFFIVIEKSLGHMPPVPPVPTSLLLNDWLTGVLLDIRPLSNKSLGQRVLGASGLSMEYSVSMLLPRHVSTELIQLIKRVRYSRFSFYREYQHD